MVLYDWEPLNTDGAFGSYLPTKSQPTLSIYIDKDHLLNGQKQQPP